MCTRIAVPVLRRRPGALLPLLAALAAPAPAVAQTETIATGIFAKGTDSPVPGDGAVFYYVRPPCGVPGVPNSTAPANIGRVPTFFGPSRTIFTFNPLRLPGTCNPFELQSNLLVDATHVYWVDNQGQLGPALKKLSRNANIGDPPVELKPLPAPGARFHELVNAGGEIFILVRNGSGSDFVSRIDKSAPDSGPLPALHTAAPGSLRQLSFDGRWAWWLTTGGALQRYDTSTGLVDTVDVGPLDLPIESYRSLGYQPVCSPLLGCSPRNPLYLVQDGNLFLSDSYRPATATVEYLSPRPFVRIGNIVRDGTDVFFIESVPGTLLPTLTIRMFRKRQGLPAELIYGPIERVSIGLSELSTDGDFLYFHDFNGASPLRIDRIANDVAALPIFDLRAVGLEVSQGIQNRANQVRLIAGKETVVRFYVRSGGATDVGDVAARLTGSNQLGGLGSLEPVNRIGKRIRVKRTPTRANLDDTFLFQLPRSWTEHGNLTLTATVNPFGALREDFTNDNSFTLSPIPFTPSPRLGIEYVNFWYRFGNDLKLTSWQDVADSQRWITQLYPIAPGSLATGGLRFTQRDVLDDGIASRVAQTHEDCERFKDDDATPPVDNRNMCAAAYAGERIAALGRAGEVSSANVWYGNIAQAGPPGANPFFTRGFARGSTLGMGPSGPASSEAYKNYAAHEMGHVFGRAHPFQGLCDHSRDDVHYPYLSATIGNHLESPETRHAGLLIREFAFQPLTFIDAQSARDTMSYCGSYWISDYTFEGIYQDLSRRGWQVRGLAARAGLADAEPAQAIAGDFLVATGTLAPSAGRGGFGVVRRLAAVADASPPEPGGFTLELRDADGALLASHGFSARAVEEDDEDYQAFDLVVPFVAGTRALRVLEDATARVLAERTVSEGAPTVSGVTLVDAPDPVDGEVTVAWSASDPDGDALAFDLFATTDDGASFRPVELSIEGTEIVLDSMRLAGGSTRLRVVATDGVQTGEALSDPFTVAGRPPEVVVQSPADGTTVQWGQLVRFEAAARDLQDDELPDAAFVWRNPYGELGTGRVLDTAALQVGANAVTVEVTNGLGLSAQAFVTVVVGDVLAPLPPTLSVAPTAFAFHVENGETAPQTARLDVSNLGPGPLSFDASSDVGWVLLDGTLGQTGVATPAAVTLSVDPTLVPPGVTSSAQVTFRSRTDPDDTLVVPVTISKGNVLDQTGSTDLDGDGLAEVSDNCPTVPNPDQADPDGDGVGSACDRCTLVPNPLQTDSNRDGFGNACDADLNDDGVVNFVDLARMKAVFFTADPHADLNEDGVVNFADLVRMRNGFFGPPGPSGEVP